MAPKLAYPVILGGPFLNSNKILIDHEFSCVTAKDECYQLLPMSTNEQVPKEEEVRNKPRAG